MNCFEISAEHFASLFHHYYEAPAPDFNCAALSEAESWSEVPANERSRMIAAVRLVLLDVSSAEHKHKNDRDRYFAKPGEAEWGS